MADNHEWVPRDVDLDRPSAARVYDYYLGGANNFASDRELARKVLDIAPEVRTAALANRGFLRRVVQLCTDMGVRQFLDIGSGIPTVGSTHEIAEELAPDSRVVYVDNEPVAVAHSELMLADKPNTGIVRADVRDVDRVLHAPETQRLLNFDEPVGVFMFALLHFIPDADDPAGLLERYRSALSSGSYLAVSHVTGDELPSEMDSVVDLYKNSQNPVTLRGRAELRALLSRFEILEPGVVFLPEWRPAHPDDVGEHPEHSVCYAALARQP